MKLLYSSTLSLLWLARVVSGDVLDLVDPLIGTVGGGERASIVAGFYGALTTTL